MALSPDERTLVTASFDNTIRWWDVANGRELRRRQFDSLIMTVAFSPDRRWLVASTGSGSIYLMHADGAELRRHYDAHVGKEVGVITFGPDGASISLRSARTASTCGLAPRTR
jgi:WD40 repeat protein